MLTFDNFIILLSCGLQTDICLVVTIIVIVPGSTLESHSN